MGLFALSRVGLGCNKFKLSHAWNLRPLACVRSAQKYNDQKWKSSAINRRKMNWYTTCACRTFVIWNLSSHLPYAVPMCSRPYARLTFTLRLCRSTLFTDRMQYWVFRRVLDREGLSVIMVMFCTESAVVVFLSLGLLCFRLVLV